MEANPNTLLSNLQSSAPSAEFTLLLNYLWEQSPTWWDAFQNWDDFLAFAIDSYGPTIASIGGCQLDVLDRALDAHSDPSSAGKYAEIKRILLLAYAQPAASTIPVTEESKDQKDRRRQELAVYKTVRQLAKDDKTYAAYDPTWECAYDPVDDIYLWRKSNPSNAGAWGTALPPYAKPRARYTGIAKYDEKGWWYGIDSMGSKSNPEERWRYIKSTSKPTGKEDPVRWLTLREYELATTPLRPNRYEYTITTPGGRTATQPLKGPLLDLLQGKSWYQDVLLPDAGEVKKDGISAWVIPGSLGNATLHVSVSPSGLKAQNRAALAGYPSEGADVSFVGFEGLVIVAGQDSATDLAYQILRDFAGEEGKVRFAKTGARTVAKVFGKRLGARDSMQLLTDADQATKSYLMKLYEDTRGRSVEEATPQSGAPNQPAAEIRLPGNGPALLELSSDQWSAVYKKLKESNPIANDPEFPSYIKFINAVIEYKKSPSLSTAKGVLHYCKENDIRPGHSIASYEKMKGTLFDSAFNRVSIIVLKDHDVQKALMQVLARA